MLREERLWKINQRIMQQKQVLCVQLASEFGLSLSTVRLDLTELEKQGYIKRVYGGAIAIGLNQAVPILNEEPYLLERLSQQKAEKEAIGKAAADLISDGETIMIDGGTTTYQVCNNLTNKKGLTIVSCALNTLWQDLIQKGNVDVFLTGGFLRAQSFSMVGDVAEKMLQNFRANKAVLGIDGIDLLHGFTARNVMEASVKKQMIASSQELIIVADHTKFGKVGLVPVAKLEQVSTIVTGCSVPKEFVSALRSHGIRVILAEPAAGIDEGLSG